MTLECELPPQEPTLFGSLGERALTALVRGIGSIASTESKIPEGYDKGVLLALRETGRLFERGITQIDLSLETPGQQVSATYSPEVHARVVSLIREPVFNRASIEGRLLMGDFKETNYRCRLHPPLADPIPCTFEEPLADAVLSALRKRVRVDGAAIIVEGNIRELRIDDIEVLGPAEFEEQGQTWTQNALDGTGDLALLAKEQGVELATDFDRLIGHFWPDDESTDEFLRSVRVWRDEGESAGGRR